jgi:hypothetical protein
MMTTMTATTIFRIAQANNKWNTALQSPSHHSITPQLEQTSHMRSADGSKSGATCNKYQRQKEKGWF